MIRSHRLIAAALSLCALTLSASPQAVAQNVYITTDRTVAGGNPLSGGNNGFVVVGADVANTPFPGVTVDITGGTITDYVNATHQSIVNISGGVIGKVSNAGTLYTALQAVQGSTINLSGGTINSFVTVGPVFGDDGTVNTFNMSGGTVPYIFNNGGAITNITGGNIAPAPGFTLGVVGNYGSGTVNITGGTMNLVGNFGSGPGTLNFGGTASTDSIRVFSGVANISGGTIGAGGVTLQQTGVANFTGNGLTVNQTGQHAFFDDGYFQNFTVADYTITGTLTSGTTVNTTVSGGADFTNNGSTATFNAPALAPDLYVTTDQTVNGVYNNINVGVDEDFNNGYNPVAAIADGTDTVYLSTFSASKTTMTGGLVRGGAFIAEQSQFNLAGGEIQNGLFAVDDAVVTISGGTVDFLSGDVNSALTVSGGNIGGITLAGNSSLTVLGSGLSASGTAGHLWDVNSGTNYLNAGNFAVSGTLADGAAFDQTILAGGASGDGSQQTLVAPKAAPDLYVLQDRTINDFNNRVTVGKDATFSTDASPTVVIKDGANLGYVTLSNKSVVTRCGGRAFYSGVVSVGTTMAAHGEYDRWDTGRTAPVWL